MAQMRTLVVGGAFTEFDGKPFVSERCWRMVRMFGEQLAAPVYARRRMDSDDRKFFSTEFPNPELLSALNPSPRRGPWELLLPDRRWHRNWYERLLENVDAVYVRFPASSWAGLHIYDMAVERNKLVFASLHGDWPEVYTHLAAAARAPLRQIYQRNARLADEAVARIARTSRVLFCVGDTLVEKFGAGAPAAVSFANYLHSEGDLFVRDDTCLEKPYRIIFVGELSQRKGVTHLIAAAGKLQASGIPVALSLVGKGDERDALIRQAEALGLKENLQLHAYVPFGPQLFDLYREADLFVLPSVAGEGLPKVTVEAMSQGLPVVATDIGSTASILEKSGGGLLVPPGNEMELTSALRRIIEDADLRRKLIRSGLEFARQMTNEHQRKVVADALAQYVPEAVRV
jgi:glycosyltransferase involved in cell wall biosynthesis